MENQFSRTELLMGASALATLRNSHVIVFGVGELVAMWWKCLPAAVWGTLTLWMMIS